MKMKNITIEKLLKLSDEEKCKVMKMIILNRIRLNFT